MRMLVTEYLVKNIFTVLHISVECIIFCLLVIGITMNHSQNQNQPKKLFNTICIKIIANIVTLYHKFFNNMHLIWIEECPKTLFKL